VHVGPTSLDNIGLDIVIIAFSSADGAVHDWTERRNNDGGYIFRLALVLVRSRKTGKIKQCQDQQNKKCATAMVTCWRENAFW
jgi:hypothetical protein